jgi:hypothetical protein
MSGRHSTLHESVAYALPRALTLLASWAATTDASEKATAADDSQEAGSVRDA